MGTIRSIWTKTCEIPKREALSGGLRAGTAVIGAGIAGVLIAAELQKRGHRVVVLEKDRIGAGQTAGTTAKITAQHGLFWKKCTDRFGTDAAALFARACTEAIDAYAAIAGRGIDFDFKRENAFVFGNDSEKLRAEYSAAKRLGLPVSVVAGPFPPIGCSAALRFENQASMHPLKLLKALSEDLEIYERTPVRAVDGMTLITDRGRVKAEHIVFACHFPFVDLPGLYFARMHTERSYLLALEGASLPGGGMWLEDKQFGLSLRPCGEYLLFGGCGHRTGENRTGGRYEALTAAAKEWFPAARVAAAWSAQDCMTADGLPYIGRYAAARPHWFAATGFGKWGMTSAMIAARLIPDLIEEKENPCKTLLDPSRCALRGVRKIASQAGRSIAGYAERAFTRPSAAPEDLAPCRGGIVRKDGKKVGAYRDGSAVCHTVRPVCTHLGCALHFNPDEHSWDCPCHGSRFDENGVLQNGPALENLPTE